MNKGRRRAADPVLTFDQLYEGHDKSVRNGERLFEAGATIFKNYQDISLGLFELGQEEIGKSFTFLAAFGYGPTDPGWRDFWSTWRDHRKKVNRAFLYEWLSPSRLQIASPAGPSLDGFTRKASIEREKEAAFYVDYLPATGRFVSPMEQTDIMDAVNRCAYLISLVVTSSYVKIALDDGDRRWNYTTFSEVARFILTGVPYQQNMPAVLARFAQRSERHRQLVDQIRSALRDGATYLRELHATSLAPRAADQSTAMEQQ